MTRVCVRACAQVRSVQRRCEREAAIVAGRPTSRGKPGRAAGDQLWTRSDTPGRQQFDHVALELRRCACVCHRKCEMFFSSEIVGKGKRATSCSIREVLDIKCVLFCRGAQNYVD